MLQLYLGYNTSRSPKCDTAVKFGNKLQLISTILGILKQVSVS